jgi:hypothetical protein
MSDSLLTILAFLERHAAVISIGLAAIAVLLGYLQYRRTPTSTQAFGEPHKKRRSNIDGELTGNHEPLLEIRFVTPECFVSCFEAAYSIPMVVHTMVFDWSKLRFRWKREGVEAEFASKLALLNRGAEPILLHGLRCVVSREAVGMADHKGTKSVLSFPCPQLRIKESDTSRSVELQPWYRVDPKQKTLWDLWIDLSVNPPFPTGDSLIDHVEIWAICDTGEYSGTIELTPNSTKWLCLENNESAE